MSRMARLWAPWRTEYIATLGRRSGCIFCQARRSRDDRQAHVLYRGRRVFCLLNRYPYNPGHLMIAMNRHVGDLAKLSPQEASELMQAAARMTTVLRRVFRSQGFNIGLNLGRAAGAGIPGHLHLHVVPRWNGDTNFMPIVGEMKVISTSLDAIYEQLKGRLARRAR